MTEPCKAACDTHKNLVKIGLLREMMADTQRDKAICWIHDRLDRRYTLTVG